MSRLALSLLSWYPFPDFYPRLDSHLEASIWPYVEKGFRTADLILNFCIPATSLRKRV